jgi:hypothetical protein
MTGTTQQPNAATRPGRDGDSDFPGGTPDEVQPQQEPADNPGQAPDEVTPGQGDNDQPDSSPIETPEPPETPSAPD